MSSLSVKPDKCAILQQTVNQIRRIKAAEGAGEGAVQQGEVSSSKPTLLPSQRLGPLLLEALDGFLFLVSTEGKIEFVSDKVSYFIKFTSEDLTGKSIYNIIHVGDHAKFSSSFMSIGWPSESTSETSRSRSFNCRLLVRPPDDQEETMEEKQQRVSQYENMQISAVLLPPSYLVDKGNSESFEGEGQQCLVCLVRRIPPNERIQGTPVEQFTTKLDTQGTIIALDASGVSPRYSQYINKERIGEQFEDLIAPGDIGKVTGHLGEALHSGQATSQVYRVKVGGDRFIRVQTKSKLFRDTDGTQPEGSFIMATHTIIGPFQEGGASATSDRLLAGTSGNGGSVLDESQGGRPSSTGGVVDDSSVSFGDNGRLRRLLSHGDDSGDLSSADGPNKILKDLLNQKDEDDTQGGGAGSGDSIRLFHRIPHLESKPNTTSSPAANSRDNNMLRELLNNEDEDNEKKSSDDIWELLNTPEDKKPDLTSEFRPPQGPPGGPMQTVNSTSSSSTPNTLSSTSSSNPQPLNSSGVPPRPPSRDMLPASTILRGMKRPSDEPHDGNPNKHQVLGAFETMLGPSPPATSMSPAPVQHGGPPTPHGGPSTPHGPPTPLGGPPTPHGGPPTPLGNNTGGNIGHVGSGSSPNNQGQSKLWEKNKMLASLLAKESPHSNPPRQTTQNVNPESLPQEKLPKILKDKAHPSPTWMSSGTSQSQILTQIFVNGPGQHTNMKSSNVSLNQQHPLGTPTSGNSVPQSNMTSQHSTNAHGRLGMNNVPMNSSVSVPTSHGGIWDMGGNSNVSVAASSVSTKTTTALPSFMDAMPRNPIGDVSSSYSEGGLPSITTAANFLSAQNNADDFLPESILNDIMEMTNIFPASGSTDEVGQPPSISSDEVHRPPTSSSYNLMEIQKIKESLISDFDTQAAPAVTGPGSLPPYTAVAPVSSIGNYPPPYTQRTRFPNAGPTGAPGGGTNVVGSMIRSSNQQFSPGSPRPNMSNQRTTLMRQQDMRKRLIQQQQNQVLVPTPASDVTQPPTSYQNMDDLFNNTIAPNRNVADSQTSPNYNILGNSPIGCGGQISPGQRIPQSPFSPVGQTTSPLPTQQYSNSGQIGSYQAQSSQLSPRLSQGSPAPPSYQTGGQPLPQMSPTGPSTPSTPGVQVPSGQQSPAWSTPSPQQRNSLMAQNPLLNAQLSYMKSDGSRQFDSGRQFHGGGRSGHLPSIRSMPSPGARQSPYPNMGPPTPGTTGQGDAGPYPPSSPQQGQSSLLYQQQQQQQQQYRCLQRTISAPGQMSGVHSPRSAHHFPPAPGHHHDPPAPPPHLPPAGGGHLPSPHSVPPSSLAHPHMGHHHPGPLPPSLMATAGSSIGPTTVTSAGPVDGGQHMMGGGPMGGGGLGSGMPGLVGGVMSQGYGGEHPPHPHNYEVAAHYFGGSDPARNSSENNKWVGESVNTSQAGGLSASPRMDDSRGNSGNDKESMLKHLLSK